MLAGKLTEPAPLSLAIDVPGVELRVLVAATHKVERGTKVGVLTVGGKETTLVYGVNLAASDDTAALSDPQARLVAPGLRSLSVAGGGKLTLTSAGGEAGLVVHAITGLER